MQRRLVSSVSRLVSSFFQNDSIETITLSNELPTDINHGLKHATSVSVRYDILNCVSINTNNF